MTTAAVLPESNMLRNLQQISEARGLKFYVNPPPNIVPDFLGTCVLTRSRAVRRVVS